MRLVFMGTPDFAAIILRQVLQAGVGQVVAAYTQPDRPCGRGGKAGRACLPTPVKQVALEHGLPVFQPLNFKDPAEVEGLRALTPDLLLVAAYGLILPQAVLDVATCGAINVHASLLPRHRGAAPIQRALLAGDPVTGISIMQMEAGLDTGPVLLQRALAIGLDDDAGSLHDQLADMGGRLLVETLRLLPEGQVKAQPQDNGRATYAAKISREDGRIDWSRPALEVHNRIRAMSPKPGAFFTWTRSPGEAPLRLGISPGRMGPELAEPLPPGTFCGLRDGALAIACADRMYLVPRLHPEGRPVMTASAFHCGYLAGAEAACAPGDLEAPSPAP